MSDSAAGNKLDFRFPRMSRGMKKLIVGYLVIFVLLVGTLAALELVQRVGIGDTRRQASINEVDMHIASAPSSVNVGDTFEIQVVVNNTNGHTITAADIELEYDSIFTLQSLVHGSYFSPDGMTHPPTTSDPYDQTLNYTDPNNPNRIAVGAFCDVCYLGDPPSPNPDNIPQCSGTPQCYPNSQNGTIDNPIIIATFMANDAGTGSIRFNQTDETHVQVAALGSDVDVDGDLTASGTITVSGTSTCTIDLDGNGSVSLADYGVFKTKYLAYLSSGAFDAAIDLDNSGTISLADYGVFKTKYIAYLSTGTCN